MNNKEKKDLQKIEVSLVELSQNIKKVHYSSKKVDDIISNDQLIGKLSICKKTAYNWRKDGLIAYKRYKKIYYNHSDVVEFLTSRSHDQFVGKI